MAVLLEQRRARKAFELVNAVSHKSGAAEKKKYSTHCRRTPQLLQQSGLCQTIAFLQSKAEMKHYLNDFASLVMDSNADVSQQLAEKSRVAEVEEYMALSAHAMQCASWMKRYAEALLGDE